MSCSIEETREMNLEQLKVKITIERFEFLKESMLESNIWSLSCKVLGLIKGIYHQRPRQLT
ncbi:hypothetical protein F7725_028505 [Dissostichus mawsoni]|uniref:Uncharacterized protein n=1 Tax=Dissostichus mawsoni TaxID=36200 RepID=A0A7J5XH33_DISMA|nr:hypothetical protein F7725_028505 [Dissostichus mawsoni]